MKNKGIDIKNYLSTERYTTRKELMEKTGLGDREVRSKISELKKERVVIYSSSKAGYRLAKELKSMSQHERDEEMKFKNLRYKVQKRTDKTYKVAAF